MMNFSAAIRNVLGRIFALWAMLVFIATMLPALLLVLIFRIYKDPRRVQLFHAMSKIWMRIFFFLTGCRLKVKGKNNFKKGNHYIVICNHNSLMDIPVTTPFIPGANKTIAKIDMAKIPLFGLIYKTGSVLVDRKDKNSRQKSLAAMKEVLDMGLHMCIYPEGTRNKTGRPLGEFHGGAFRLAFETKSDIIPALIFNTRRILPGNKIFYFWPSKIELHFLTAVPVKESDNYEALKEKLYNLMVAYYSNNRQNA
ncbi:MAG TPA: 1-acyl-sn-glycerol-3-phosphate acyltransferase [Chitinophagaceae bacterium]|nr:1-acyl-sn-glycerol-3-phosphate acyltransferase [Chitinophagaceae bacterium]